MYNIIVEPYNVYLEITIDTYYTKFSIQCVQIKHRTWIAEILEGDFKKAIMQAKQEERTKLQSGLKGLLGIK